MRTFLALFVSLSIHAGSPVSDFFRSTALLVAAIKKPFFTELREQETLEEKQEAHKQLKAENRLRLYNIHRGQLAKAGLTDAADFVEGGGASNPSGLSLHTVISQALEISTQSSSHSIPFRTLPGGGDSDPSGSNAVADSEIAPESPNFFLNSKQDDSELLETAIASGNVKMFEDLISQPNFNPNAIIREDESVLEVVTQSSIPIFLTILLTHPSLEIPEDRTFQADPERESLIESARLIKLGRKTDFDNLLNLAHYRGIACLLKTYPNLFSELEFDFAIEIVVTLQNAAEDAGSDLMVKNCQETIELLSRALQIQNPQNFFLLEKKPRQSIQDEEAETWNRNTRDYLKRDRLLFEYNEEKLRNLQLNQESDAWDIFEQQLQPFRVKRTETLEREAEINRQRNIAENNRRQISERISRTKEQAFDRARNLQAEEDRAFGAIVQQESSEKTEFLQRQQEILERQQESDRRIFLSSESTSRLHINDEEAALFDRLLSEFGESLRPLSLIHHNNQKFLRSKDAAAVKESSTLFKAVWIANDDLINWLLTQPQAAQMLNNSHVELAIRLKKPAVLKTLLELFDRLNLVLDPKLNSNPNAKKGSDEYRIHKAISDYRQSHPIPEAPLWVAIREGRTETLRALLTTREQLTTLIPLNYALTHGQLESYKIIIEIMKKFGIEVRSHWPYGTNRF